MNMFALFAFGLLVFAPACCGKKCKVTEVEKTEVVEVTVTETRTADAQPKQIKF